MLRLISALVLLGAAFVPAFAAAPPSDLRLLFERDRFAEVATAEGDPVLRAAALIRLGRMDEARALALAQSQGGGLDMVALALVEAGELGRARAVLTTLVKANPGNPDPLVRLADLESRAGRLVHAIAPLEQAVELAPTEPRYRRALIQAWRDAGMPVRAGEAFAAARDAGAVDDEVFAVGLAAMQSYGAHGDAADLAEDWVDAHPHALPVLRALALSQAALGGEDRAARSLRRYLAVAAPDPDIITLIAKVFDEPERRKLMDNLRGRYPAMAELFGPDVPLPRHLAWPWLADAAVAQERGDMAQARQVLLDGLASVKAPLGRGHLALRLAEVEADVDAALARADEAATLGMPLGAVEEARYRILAKAQQWRPAAQAAWRWSALRPDDNDALDALFRLEIAERLGWGRVFARLHDHVQRDPEDATRQLHGLERHVGTGGNALIALGHAQALERLVPGDDPRHKRGRVLAARLSATLAEIGRVEDMNPQAGRLTLIRPDGTRVAVHSAPVTGRLIRFAEADRWIAARWSADGFELLGLTDSDGNSLSMERRDGLPVVVEARGKTAFRARLGEDGTPVEVLSPLGEIRAVAAYNNALAVLAAWPRTGIAGARWLRLVAEQD